MESPLILIVDDEESIVAGLETRLVQAGYRVARACDGPEAIGLARSILPSLILLDQCLPGMSGLQVLALLRDNPLTSDIPVVVISGAATKDHPAMSAGAAAFLLKPYRKDELLDLVDSLLALPYASKGETCYMERLF